MTNYNYLLSFTENGSATYSSSGDACVDFFFQVVPGSPDSQIVSLVSQAWQQDPLTALRLIFHLRGVRGTGKSNSEAFYICASWLQQHHPQTLLANLESVASFGYYKDLLEMVLREVEGSAETHKRLMEKKEHNEKVRLAKSRSKSDGFRIHVPFRYRSKRGPGYWSRKGEAARLEKMAGTLQDRDVRIATSLKRDMEVKEEAAKLRRNKRSAMAERYEKMYCSNPNLAALRDAVADIFSSRLRFDKEALEKEDYHSISLAAKWCPSSSKSYDLRTGLSGAIACRLFELPKECDKETAISIVSDRMRKEYLTPLRKAIEIPERYMSANEWGILPYERVPSVAMKNYVDVFTKHDKSRFIEFLEKVALGKKKLAAGALLPHDIVKTAVQNMGSISAVVAEAQWKRMVADLRESEGKSNMMSNRLSSSLAVCDVSGSMEGIPMEVCIALGMLVAELSEEPWKNLVCTFSEHPQIHSIKGDTLVDRYKFVKRMDWGCNTDFQAVFRLLLNIATANKLTPEKMVKRLFVFSDMEFDQASANPWETDYEVITRSFQEAGYGDPPEIVFWNLRASMSTPVLATQKGVALVSGFSKNLLKLFLEGDEGLEQFQALQMSEKSENTEKAKMDPREVMKKAITGELYEHLKVVD